MSIRVFRPGSPPPAPRGVRGSDASRGDDRRDGRQSERQRDRGDQRGDSSRLNPARAPQPLNTPARGQQQLPARGPEAIAHALSVLANAGVAPRARQHPRYDEDAAPRPRSSPPRGPSEDAASEPEGDRLNKRMAALGMASRREADEWIDKGLVRVNGKVARMGQRVTEADDISVSDEAKASQADRVTILLHKPIGWVSGQPEDGHPAAIELITSDSLDTRTEKVKPFKTWHLKSLAPCGRLDIDSTGLLVLSQDGRVARAIIGEDSDMEKEYLVRVEYQGAPEIGLRDAADTKDMPPTQGEAFSAVKRNVKAVFPPEALEQLRHGLALDGQELLPAKVSWQNEEQLRFVLREGKKRQIRRMCELVGLKVVGLKRIRIGRIVLGELPPGKWRYLQSWEKF